MKAIVINKLKEYYDVFKVSEVEKGDRLIAPHKTDMALLEEHIKDGNTSKATELIKGLTNENWKYMETIFDLPMFHIFYFEDQKDLFGKGINIFEIDMMSAVEKFESETGFKPHICMTKEK